MFFNVLCKSEKQATLVSKWVRRNSRTEGGSALLHDLCCVGGRRWLSTTPFCCSATISRQTFRNGRKDACVTLRSSTNSRNLRGAQGPMPSPPIFCASRNSSAFPFSRKSSGSLEPSFFPSPSASTSFSFSSASSVTGNSSSFSASSLSSSRPPPPPPPPPSSSSSHARPLSFVVLLEEAQQRSLEKYVQVLLSSTAEKQKGDGKNSRLLLSSAPYYTSFLDTTAFTQAFAPLRQFTLHLVHAIFQDLLPALLRRAHCGGSPYQGVEVDTLRVQTRWDRRHGAQLGELKEVIEAFEFVFFRIEREVPRKGKEEAHRSDGVKKAKEMTGKKEGSGASSVAPSTSSTIECCSVMRVFAYPSAPVPHVLYARVIARLFPSSLGLFKNATRAKMSRASSHPFVSAFSSVGGLGAASRIDPSFPSSFLLPQGALPVTFPMAFIGEALAWGRLFAPLCGPLPRLLSHCGRKTDKAQLLPTRWRSLEMFPSPCQRPNGPVRHCPSKMEDTPSTSTSKVMDTIMTERSTRRKKNLRGELSDTPPSSFFSVAEKSPDGLPAGRTFVDASRHPVLSSSIQRTHCVLRFAYRSAPGETLQHTENDFNACPSLPTGRTSCTSGMSCWNEALSVLCKEELHDDICWLFAFDVLCEGRNIGPTFTKGGNREMVEGREAKKTAEKMEEELSSVPVITLELLLQVYCAIVISLSVSPSGSEWPSLPSPVEQRAMYTTHTMEAPRRELETRDANTRTHRERIDAMEGRVRRLIEEPVWKRFLAKDVRIRWMESYLEEEREETAEKICGDEGCATHHMLPKTKKSGGVDLPKDHTSLLRKKRRLFGKEKVAASVLTYLLHRFPLQLRLQIPKKTGRVGENTQQEQWLSSSPLLHVFGGPYRHRTVTRATAAEKKERQNGTYSNVVSSDSLPLFSLCPLSPYITPYLSSTFSPHLFLNTYAELVHPIKKGLCTEPWKPRTCVSSSPGRIFGLPLHYLKNQVLEWDYFSSSSSFPVQRCVIKKKNDGMRVGTNAEPMKTKKKVEEKAYVGSSSAFISQENNSSPRAWGEGKGGHTNCTTILFWFPPIYYHPALRSLVKVALASPSGVRNETEGKKSTGENSGGETPTASSSTRKESSDLHLKERKFKSPQGRLPLTDGCIKPHDVSFSSTAQSMRATLEPLDGEDITTVLFPRTPCGAASSSPPPSSCVLETDRRIRTIWNETNEEVEMVGKEVTEVHEIESCSISLLSILWAYTSWMQGEEQGPRPIMVNTSSEKELCRSRGHHTPPFEDTNLGANEEESGARGGSLFLRRCSGDGIEIAIPLPSYRCVRSSFVVDCTEEGVRRKTPVESVKDESVGCRDVLYFSPIASEPSFDAILCRSFSSHLSYPDRRSSSPLESVFFSDDPVDPALIANQQPLLSFRVFPPGTPFRNAPMTGSRVEERTPTSVPEKENDLSSISSTFSFPFRGIPSIPMSVMEALHVLD